MASGFWYLKDGRGYARRVNFMIELFAEIHSELLLTDSSKAFSEYLNQFLFTADHELNGYGGFYNKKTAESVMMIIDFREFTKENQNAFWAAAQIRLNKLIVKNVAEDKVMVEELKILLDMNKRANKGEDPMGLNHMRDIIPPSGKKKGPGWN